jgi:hypothetical protein
MAEEQTKPDLASLVARIAREECRRLYEKRLTGLEEELAAAVLVQPAMIRRTRPLAYIPSEETIPRFL